MVILQKFELWFLQFISFFIGCWFFIFLQSEYQLSSVLASAIVGLLASFVPESRRISSVHAQATIYTGSFIAMGTRLDTHSIWQLVCVSAVGAAFVASSFVYFCKKNFFSFL